MKKVLGMVVLAVALLIPAQSVLAGEKERKGTEETQQRLENAVKTKERKTPEQEKEMAKRFQDFNEYLDGLMKRAG